MSLKYNYRKLSKVIQQKFQSPEKFFHAIGIPFASLMAKFDNKGRFSQVEMEKMISALDIPEKEIGPYFFTIVRSMN